MLRRRKVWFSVVMLVLAGGGAVLMVFPPGCAEMHPVNGQLDVTNDRSQRIMALAAEEAAAIPDIDARLTRQLNLADVQIQRGWPVDARVTLAAARGTLQTKVAAQQLNDHARISGWISVSQLARQAKDLALAITACDSAAVAMMAIEDPAKRCQYVMGIGNELQYLKGKPAAAALLAQAAPWTKSIDNVPTRRAATVAFACALFTLDDFDDAKAMFRQDDDAAWRSQMLQTLASPAEVTNLRQIGAASAVAPFGKDLNYRTIFQNQTNSQTSKE